LKVNQYSPTQFDVQVVANVIYTKYATIEETQQPMDVTKSESIYLDVPVLLVGDKMVIEDIPLLTAPPNIGEVTRYEFTGSYSEDTDKNAAKLMLEDFFKTLYGDSQSKIDYYLAPGADTSKFIARNSPYTYEQIDKFSLFTLGNGSYRAILTIRMNDPNGTRVRQRFNVELIRDGKFYIKDIGLRGYNLK